MLFVLKIFLFQIYFGHKKYRKYKSNCILLMKFIYIVNDKCKTVNIPGILYNAYKSTSIHLMEANISSTLMCHFYFYIHNRITTRHHFQRNNLYRLTSLYGPKLLGSSTSSLLAQLFTTAAFDR